MREGLRLAAMVVVVASGASVLSGCAKQSGGEPDAPAAGEPAGDAGLPEGGQAKLGLISAAECEAQSGEVVGDIGDGAIYRADYVCASGERPFAAIQPAEGEPIAVEGSICCPT